jgi:hypothetical protein
MALDPGMHAGMTDDGGIYPVGGSFVVLGRTDTA